MKIGFIGLGRMGASMATNLIRAGHDVSVFNRSRGKSDPLIKLGAHRASSVAETCAADAVITMVSDDDAASGVAFGGNGLVTHLPKGAIHVSMSSISVALSKRLAEAHAQAGQRYVAAPVFGRPDMAAAAKLFIVVAGDPATIDVCQPLFRVMGQKTIPIGTEPSAANLVKLSGNFLMASVIESLGEAVALIAKAGIDRLAYIELLTSSIFNVPAYKTYGGLIAREQFQPAAFAAPLGYKDIRLTLAAAQNLGVPMPLGSLLHDRFLRLINQGGSDLDWSALGGLSARDAGTEFEAAS